MNNKRPKRVIPIFVQPMNDGHADEHGFKIYRVIIGEGGLRPVLQFHVDTSKTGGTENIVFKVVKKKP